MKTQDILIVHPFYNEQVKVLNEVILLSTLEGIGKPEPLEHHLTGYWSNRIKKEYRLVYEITDNLVLILSAKVHYI